MPHNEQPTNPESELPFKSAYEKLSDAERLLLEVTIFNEGTPLEYLLKNIHDPEEAEKAMGYLTGYLGMKAKGANAEELKAQERSARAYFDQY